MATRTYFNNRTAALASAPDLARHMEICDPCLDQPESPLKDPHTSHADHVEMPTLNWWRVNIWTVACAASIVLACGALGQHGGPQALRGEFPWL